MIRALIRRLTAAALARTSMPAGPAAGRPEPHTDNQLGQLGTLPFTRPLVRWRYPRCPDECPGHGDVAVWVDGKDIRAVPYVPGPDA